MYKVGDTVRIIDNDSCNLYIGLVTTIKSVDYPDFEYKYSLTGIEVEGYWADWELELVKASKVENKKMATKAYKVINDTPAWNHGAIVVQNDDGDYEPIENLWDAVENNEDYSECANVVENNPEFFERVYEMSKGKKAVYVTKEKAKEMASKFYETE